MFGAASARRSGVEPDGGPLDLGPPRVIPAAVDVSGGLRGLMHLLVFLLCSVLAIGARSDGVAVLLVLGFGLVYALGLVAPRGWPAWTRYVWLTLLVAVWFAVLVRYPIGGYLVLPLYFLFLHLIPGHRSIPAVLGVTALTVVVFGARQGWTVAGVLGPVVGALVALALGYWYASTQLQSRARERLMEQLLDARAELSSTEREAGVLAERARLARELHDTVAQGLASIQLLLHAAERELGPDTVAAPQLRLARETAAENLAETRRFIRDLAPPALADEGLPAALRRLGRTDPTGPLVEVDAPERLDLPMDVATALLRIAQGALANARTHSGADGVTITLEGGDGVVRLSVVDDGHGFDVERVLAGAGRVGSFGLRAARERAEQLDGRLTVTAAPGVGTTVLAEIPWEDEE